MKASGSCRRMESKAPVSSVVRASQRSCGEVAGVGRRALRARSCRLADERREAIFCADGGGVDLSWVRVVFSSVLDMLGNAGAACFEGGKRLWLCFGKT